MISEVTAFYSTIAQTSGVIVGIWGAFLTARVLAREKNKADLVRQYEENDIHIDEIRGETHYYGEEILKNTLEASERSLDNYLVYLSHKINLENPFPAKSVAKMLYNHFSGHITKKKIIERYNQMLDELRENKRRKKIELSDDRIRDNRRIIDTGYQATQQYYNLSRKYGLEISVIAQQQQKIIRELIEIEQPSDLMRQFTFLVYLAILGILMPIFIMLFNEQIMRYYQLPFFLAFLSVTLAAFVLLFNEIIKLKFTHITMRTHSEQDRALAELLKKTQMFQSD